MGTRIDYVTLSIEVDAVSGNCKAEAEHSIRPNGWDTKSRNVTERVIAKGRFGSVVSAWTSCMIKYQNTTP